VTAAPRLGSGLPLGRLVSVSAVHGLGPRNGPGAVVRTSDRTARAECARCVWPLGRGAEHAPARVVAWSRVDTTRPMLQGCEIMRSTTRRTVLPWSRGQRVREGNKAAPPDSMAELRSCADHGSWLWHNRLVLRSDPRGTAQKKGTHLVAEAVPMSVAFTALPQRRLYPPSSVPDQSSVISGSEPRCSPVPRPTSGTSSTP